MGGTFTRAFVTAKPGWLSAASLASSFFRNAKPRLAAAAVLYFSIPVWTLVTPAAPVNASPYSSTYPLRRPSFLKVEGVPSGVLDAAAAFETTPELYASGRPLTAAPIADFGSGMSARFTRGACVAAPAAGA